MRAVAMEAALTVDATGQDIGAAASLALAHSLAVPLVTKNREMGSRQVPVLHC